MFTQKDIKDYLAIKNEVQANVKEEGRCSSPC